MTKNLKLTTDVKKQHTVPRFLLDHFGFGKNKRKRRLFTFDKHNLKIFQQSVFDATTRNTFYNVEEHPEDASLEPILGLIETEAATVIKKIVKSKTLTGLSQDEVSKLSTFVVVQKSRTYHGLQSLKTMVSGLKTKISKMEAEEGLTKSFEEFSSSVELKNTFLKSILSNSEHAPHISNKAWILYETTENNPFYISDNPVTLYNHIDMGFYGNLGLAVKGIQIHLPLSSTLTLAFTCPSLAENAIRTRDQLASSMVNNNSPLLSLKERQNIFDCADAYEHGKPLQANSDNVIFLNSLQVRYSEQYLFCQHNEFSLVKEMISVDEGFKQGIRPTIN